MVKGLLGRREDARSVASVVGIVLMPELWPVRWLQPREPLCQICTSATNFLFLDARAALATAEKP